MHISFYYKHDQIFPTHATEEEWHAHVSHTFCMDKIFEGLTLNHELISSSLQALVQSTSLNPTIFVQLV